MTSAVQADFFTVMRERHAVKHFDPAHKLSESEINFLLEIAGSAPSAWNLQPWRFLVIAEQRLQEKTAPGSVRSAPGGGGFRRDRCPGGP